MTAKYYILDQLPHTLEGGNRGNHGNALPWQQGVVTKVITFKISKTTTGLCVKNTKSISMSRGL